MTNRRNYFTLVKFGVSEIKRKNLKQTYTLYTDWLNKNGPSFYKNKEAVYKEWKEIKIYEDQKKESNVDREIIFLKQNGFIKTNNTNNNGYNFVISEITINWDNNGQNLFFLKDIDYSFFQFLLKQKFLEKGKEKSAFVHIFKNLLHNKELNPDIIISNNYINEMKIGIINKDKNKILKLIKYKSGSPNKSNNKELNIFHIEKDSIRNSIIDLYIDFFLDKGKYEINLINEIKRYFNLIHNFNENSSGSKAKIASGLLELIFNKNSLDNYAISDLVKMKDHEIIAKINIKNDEDFLNRIKNKIIFSSYSDYKNLIMNHINCLSSLFDISKKNDILVFNVHDKSIEKFLLELTEKEEEILKLKVDRFYKKDELLHELNIKNLDNLGNIDWQTLDNINDKQINDCYTFEKIRAILNSISEAILIQKKDYNINKIQKIISNDEHVKGQVNWPTYYEFIIGITFLKKIYGETSQNWKNKIEKHLRLTIDGSLCPIRFAGAGRADIIFNDHDKISIIEPTTQLYRQVKHEHDSVIDHLENEIKKSSIKISYGFSILVAPKIEEKFMDSISGFNSKNDNKEILAFDNSSLIKILDSQYSNNNIWNLDFLQSLVASDFIIIDNKIEETELS